MSTHSCTLSTHTSTLSTPTSTLSTDTCTLSSGQCPPTPASTCIHFCPVSLLLLLQLTIDADTKHLLSLLHPLSQNYVNSTNWGKGRQKYRVKNVTHQSKNSSSQLYVRALCWFHHRSGCACWWRGAWPTGRCSWAPPHSPAAWLSGRAWCFSSPWSGWGLACLNFQKLLKSKNLTSLISLGSAWPLCTWGSNKVLASIWRLKYFWGRLTFCIYRLKCIGRKYRKFHPPTESEF